MEKAQYKKVLKESKMLAGAFAYLVLEVSLLEEVHQMLVRVGKAIDEIAAEVDSYEGDDFLAHLQKMDAINYLDEMVDFDPVSELEARFYEMSGEQASKGLSEFLMQIVDKIEKAHAALIEKLHDFNALLEG
jgi:hypothetical protein